MGFVLITLAGCLDDDGDTAANEQLPEFDRTIKHTHNDLNGTWQLSECFVDELQSYTLFINIDNREWNTTVITYDDTDCNNPALATVTENITIVRGKKNLSNGATVTQFDLLTTSEHLVPIEQYVADSFNYEGYCGTTEWAKGIATNSAQCAVNASGKPLIGSYRYDIYLVEDGILYLGTDSGAQADGTSPDKRFNTLNYGSFYMKKN